MNNTFINNYDLDSSFLNSHLNKLIKKGVSFADFYLQKNLSESWSLDEGIIKSGSYALTEGIAIRAICHDKTFLNHTSVINKPIINSIVDNLFIEKSNNIHNTHVKKNISNNLYVSDNIITATNSIEKIKILQEINRYARTLELVTNVIASLSLEYDEIAIINSEGKLCYDRRPLIHLGINIVINNNGTIERGNSGLGGRFSLEKLTMENIYKHIKSAHEYAILKSTAKECPQGKMPVILGNGWAGVILHEAVGHGLEGDFNRKGSSAFSNKIGQKVASELVTVIDDGSINERRGSLNIDDEGNHCQKNILIENGILKSYMFDELNAKLMGTFSTGNGRRESYASIPMPRMTNTFMQNGEHTKEEIIASVEDGLYAEQFEGGQVDITSGQFVFNASIAWVIKNGKLSHPVKGCALVGSGPECLKYVSMVGNDFSLDSGIGNCGKNGQTVPVGVGQPTIRIDDGLIVGGTL